MGSVSTHSRKSIGILAIVLLLLGAGLMANYPLATTAFAQDEPTDRPFPTAVTQAVTSSAASATNTAGADEATPTTRPFPTAIPKTPTPEVATSSATGVATTAVPPAATAAAAAPSTPALTIDDAMATITAMQAENKDLQDKLTSAQNDKGATLFAVAIVVIGLGLAFAVFFGLKQSGK